MTDTSIVIARLKDGPIVKVAGTISEDWQLVQARWRWLDEAKRKGRLYVEDDRSDGWLYIKPANVAWLAVRSFNDPVVTKAMVTIALFVTSGRDAQTHSTVARRWGNAHGYHGHVGGWLYRNPCRAGEHAVTQGWSSIVPHRAIGATLAPGNVRYHLIENMPKEVNP
jgi:hypothetical protein